MRSPPAPSPLRPALLALTACLLLAIGSHGFHQQICGKSLPQTLALVCGNCYNTRDKKFVHHSALDDDSLWEYASAPRPRLPARPRRAQEDAEAQEELDVDLQPSPPFRERLRAADMLGDTFRRFARGVADECCHKACTYAEIANYCCKGQANY